MRLRVMGMSLLATLFAMPAMAAAPAVTEAAPGSIPAIKPRRNIARSPLPNPGYRSRGKQAKPRKRPNRRHISRRVRRAHRRAKAA